MFSLKSKSPLFYSGKVASLIGLEPTTFSPLTSKAVHVWELKPESGNQTLLTMKESMDGPLMAEIYSSEKLTEADNEWLVALKRAAEQKP